MNLTDILSESAREFDAKFHERGRDSDGYVFERDVNTKENCWDSYDARPDLKAFLLSKQRAVIEAVIAECEGMIGKPVCRNRACGKENHLCENTVRNAALSDLISRLREALNETV